MVSQDKPSSNGGSENSFTTSHKLYSESFEKVFPYYLSIGMNETQFWDSDPELVRAYRKAEEIRNERKNQEMWLLGAYIYDSLLRVSPIFHDFAKRGTKPVPYIEEPYIISEKKAKEKAKNEEETRAEKIKTKMLSFMAKNNKKFERE